MTSFQEEKTEKPTELKKRVFLQFFFIGDKVLSHLTSPCWNGEPVIKLKIFFSFLERLLGVYGFNKKANKCRHRRRCSDLHFPYYKHRPQNSPSKKHNFLYRHRPKYDWYWKNFFFGTIVEKGMSWHKKVIAFLLQMIFRMELWGVSAAATAAIWWIYMHNKHKINPLDSSLESLKFLVFLLSVEAAAAAEKRHYTFKWGVLCSRVDMFSRRTVCIGCRQPSPIHTHIL